MKAPAPLAVDPGIGAFLPNGSWKSGALPGPCHGFVMELIRQRRQEPATPPWEFAKRIACSPFRSAFPSILEWVRTIPVGTIRLGTSRLAGQSIATPWWLVGASTAAESALKRCVFYDAEARALSLALPPGQNLLELPDLGFESQLVRRTRLRMDDEQAERARQLEQVRQAAQTWTP